MEIFLDPARIRTGWDNATSAHGELEEARSHVAAAGGSGLDDLQATLSDAARDMDGVLRVAQGALEALGGSVEQCLETYRLTEGRSAGGFDGLR